MINNSFVFSSASLSTAINVGPDTLPATFVFSNNFWYASDDPAQSSPTLPVPETDGVSGMRSSYIGIEEDPHVTPHGFLCTGAAEDRGIVLPEVDGTIIGVCRSGPPTTIGPYSTQSCTL